jgi:HK97 family phage major capsid protein
MTLSSTATRAELLQRKSEISKQLVSYRGRISSLTEADGAEIERLAEEKDAIELQLERAGSTGARSPGRTTTVDLGATAEDRDRDLSPFVREARDEALRAVERVVNSGRIEPDAADRVDNLIRHEDTRTGVGARYLAAVGDQHYLSAFITMLRSPESAHLRMTPREHEAVRRVVAVQEERAMGVTTGSAGGFGIPIDLDPSILSTGSGSLNPIRQIANVRTTIGDIWKGVSADAPTAAYQAEAAEMNDASPTLVQPSITTQRGSAFIPVSYEIIMDWPQDQLVEELRNLLDESKNNLDSSKWLTGTGTNEPGGILNIGSTGGLTTTQRLQTTTTAVTAIGDVYALKQLIGSTKFAQNATWVANGTTFDIIYRFVASGSTSEPQIFFQGRQGPLLGKPIVEWSNMASTTTTTGSKIVIYGDWSGFTVVDRLGSTVEIVPQLFAAANLRPSGQRGIVYWWRSGSGVTKANALRYLEVK